MKCHPLLYLCVLVTVITVINVAYITKSNRKLPIKKPGFKTRTKVTLIENDEHTILSRIRYPDRTASILFGHLPDDPIAGQKKRKTLALGIATVARPPGVEYLSKSLHRVIDALDEKETAKVVIVVAMMDREKKTREDRAKILYRKFRSSVDSGLVTIIAPTSNIYPSTNFYLMNRRPFNNTIERMEWQAKLSLDFAFLFSFCSQIGEFFMNLEDDVVPAKHFVNETLKFAAERDAKREEWSSLQFSNYLSIGRFYRCSDLNRLVELILLSFTRQPVDFIMHHFDVLQMADHFREFRRTPPLIEHVGAKSTIDVESIRAKITRKYEAFKKANPKAELTTNMTQWLNYSIEAAYRPNRGHFFWARQFSCGDVVDINFKRGLAVKAVYVVTGFDPEEERAGTDRLTDGSLFAAKDEHCNAWTLVSRGVDAAGKMVANDTNGMSQTRCLRLQVLKGTSDWLVIRLMRVMLL